VNAISKIVGDLIGISRACGPAAALRWAANLALNAPEIIHARDLLPADRGMGEGPFTVRHKMGTAKLTSDIPFAGIREIWIRDVYGLNGQLTIADGDLVVDLGANVGNFSMLALAAAKGARVIAVEAQAFLIERLEAQAKLNGCADRLSICNAFLGDITALQEMILSLPDCKTPIISEAAFLSRYQIEKIDFLKCDIEGSEFAFLDPDSKLIDISRQVAFELHSWGGDMKHFIDVLKTKGFTILSVDWAETCCIVLAAKR
jgi:SAM-dependent methyltransferase